MLVLAQQQQVYCFHAIYFTFQAQQNRWNDDASVDGTLSSRQRSTSWWGEKWYEDSKTKEIGLTDKMIITTTIS